MKQSLSLIFFAIILTACADATSPTPSSPAVSSPAFVTAIPSIAPTSTPLLSATSPKASPTPFITAPAPNDAALVPILMYHHIKDLPANASELDLTWTVAPKNFQVQMEWLAQRGYQTIAMTHLNAHLKQRVPLPTKPILITFDDGWVEGYTVAFPVLKKNNFIGTYFVYTQPVDRSPLFLSWKQIEEMSAGGMAFEGHTLSHPHLESLSLDNATREIVESKKILETRLKKPVVAFAYPFGEFNNTVIEMVKRAGFESAVTIDPGYRQRADRIYLLQRIRISYNETLQDFASKLPP